jgi:amino acid adenylation domain-containing protein
MSVLPFLSKLEKLQINIQLLDNQLKIDAPRGNLTGDVVAELKTKKSAIIEFLQSRVQRQVKYASILPAEEREYYPLSSAQMRLYFLQQMDLQSTVYNMPDIVEIGQYIPVDVKRVEETFRKLIRRHGSLRTCFQLVEDRPVQRVYRDVDFAVEHRSLDDRPQTRAEIMAAFIRPFDLAKAPLLRVVLIKTSQKKYMLLLDIHHAVADGLSHDILVKDFLTLYNGEALPRLRVQYRDYAWWQNSQSQRQAIKAQQAYWLKEYGGEIPVLDIPTDYSRPPLQSFKGAVFAFEIPARETQALREMSLEQGFTLFALMLAIYTIMLNKLGGQEDIIVGTSVAGRSHADLEGLIGMFVNTLALRNYPSAGKSVMGFLQEVNQRAIKAFENQDYQFEDLVEKVVINRDASRNPLFDVTFSLKEADGSGASNSAADVSPQSQGRAVESRGVSRFDMSWGGSDTGDRLTFGIEYCTRLFKQETISRFIKIFTRIMNLVLEDPGREIADIEVVTEEEKKKILYGFNEAGASLSADQSIQQLWAERVRQNPLRLALVYEDRLLTYKAVDERANRLARLLREKGTGRETTVAVLMGRSGEMIVAILAILKAGAAYVPVDPRLSGYGLDSLLAHGDTRLVVAGPQVQPEQGTTKQFEVVMIEEVDFDAYSTAGPVHLNGPEDLACVLYRPGPGGSPGGIMIEHEAVVYLLKGLLGLYPQDESHRYLLKSPLSAGTPLSELFGWIPGGCGLVILEEGKENDLQAMLDLIARQGVTHITIAPSLIFTFLSAINPRDFDKLLVLKHVFLTGEELLTEQADELDKMRGPESVTVFENLYGRRECAGYVSRYPLSDWDRGGKIPIGKPLPQVKLFVLDRWGHVQAPGVGGELYIAGARLSRGYVNNPELTADRFVESPLVPGERLFKTGDRCRWLDDGSLEFLGRPGQEQPVAQAGVRRPLTPEERHKILYQFNDTGSQYPRHLTLPELFQQQVERTPQQTAVVFNGRQLTYRELNEKANRLARLLKEAGVGPDTIVGIMVERSLEMVVGLIGILKAGGAYLPIDVKAPEQRIVNMLEDCRAPILLTQTGTVKPFSFTALQYRRSSLDSPPQVTAPRPQVKDFDSLPYPDSSLVDYEKYNRSIGLAMVKNRITLQGTRGCPFDCAYCHKIWPKSHVARSAENIFGEIKPYYDMGIKRFSFVDDVFNLNVENSSRFFQMIIDQGMDVQIFFNGGLRGDILTPGYIDLIVQAGTISFALALETASPRLQKYIGKNLNLEKLHENIQYICSRHPRVILELQTMHGFPTETEEEALMTLDFIKSLRWLHFPYIHILRIYQNSRMEKLALESGISIDSIIRAEKLAFHELPDTLPFNKSFTVQYQTRFFDEYFLSKERLRHVLPYQMRILTEEELVRKYDSYLPTDIDGFAGLLEFLGLSPAELEAKACVAEERVAVPDLNARIRDIFRGAEGEHPGVEDKGALRVLLLDLSRFFSGDVEMLYNVNEPPLGLLYLATYLNRQFGGKVSVNIAKSGVDFDSYPALKQLVEAFNPQVIGLRTLTLYRDFFHRTAALIKQWRGDIPIVTGGPYATSDYRTILQDRNIDLVVLGEGEVTFAELIGKMIAHEGKWPPLQDLEQIRGIAFIPQDQAAPREFARRILMLDELDEALNKRSVENLEPDQRPHNLAYVTFTSGSTGIPKGVLVEHKNAVNVVSWFAGKYDLGPGKRVLQMSEYTFDASVNQFFGTLSSGAALYLIDRELLIDTARLREFIDVNGIHLVNFVPAYLRQLLGFEKKLASLDLVISGGENLVKETRDVILDKGYRLFNQYGPTEATIDALWAECSNDGAHLGRPIANMMCYILDERDRVVPLGVTGELQVSGAGIARGYLNRPDLTRQRFTPNPFKPGETVYRTGDLARFLPDGNVEYLGRSDDQVKIRGFRIEPGEIEAQLQSHDRIREAVVVGRADGGGERYLCAYFAADGELLASELRGFLAARLPDYMIPSYFIQLEKMPLTVHGKIDRRALPRPAAEGAEGYVAPRDEMEEKLRDMWAGILGLDRESIGIEHNFFEFGGTSINLINLVSKIRNELAAEVPISQIYNNPTIKEIAKSLKTKNFTEQTVVLLNRPTARKLFCFPPKIGYGFHYSELASLVEDYSFYSFNFIEAEDRIARYVDIITDLQPRGPYIFFGMSAAGRLTFQVTRALEERGLEVSDIIFADCYFNEQRSPSHDEEEMRSYRRRVNEYLEGHGVPFLREQVMKKTEDYIAYCQNVTQLEKINARIHLIVSESALINVYDDPLCWDPLTGKGVTRYQGFGRHEFMFTPGFGSLEKNAGIFKSILAGIQT